MTPDLLNRISSDDPMAKDQKTNDTFFRYNAEDCFLSRPRKHLARKGVNVLTINRAEVLAS